MARVLSLTVSIIACVLLVQSQSRREKKPPCFSSLGACPDSGCYEDTSAEGWENILKHHRPEKGEEPISLTVKDFITLQEPRTSYCTHYCSSEFLRPDQRCRRARESVLVLKYPELHREENRYLLKFEQLGQCEHITPPLLLVHRNR
jgi:hypothetical protein